MNINNLTYRFLRILCLFLCVFFVLLLFYQLWTPGTVIQDGRFDLSQNGIWLQHSWLGTDDWFHRNRKSPTIFRSKKSIIKLYTTLRKHHIKYVYPHLAPTSQGGRIPHVNHTQMITFLKVFKHIHILPWVGGAWNKQAFPSDPKWRKRFTQSVNRLLSKYPQLSGVHINIEPCTSGNIPFLKLLEETKSILKNKKILSVAAYPPPTIFQPSLEVHWNHDYYSKITKHSDQLVVMMYDTSLRFVKQYQWLYSSWTQEVLSWAGSNEVLFGIPAYEEKGVEYHHSDVENIRNSILGLNTGLSSYSNLPTNYKGIAIYSDWVMNSEKWKVIRNQFLSGQKTN